MANYSNEDGVWRTIGGRRVFIRTGQSLEDAMRESGKFSRVAKNQELYKKVDEENKKIDEIVKKEEKKKDISTNEAVNEFMSADVGDWNNMNQAERDKVCENILKDFENKYGNKLEDEKFRSEVLNQLEEENFHTMVKTIDNKYNQKYGTNALDKMAKSDKDLKSLDQRIAEAEKKEFTKQELKDVYGTDNVELINAGRPKEDRVSLKEEKDENKTIHTPSGDYTYEEMQKRDKEVKDLYKSTWKGETSYKELNDKLEEMRKNGKISSGELSSLQYDASMEYDRELEKAKKEIEIPKKEETFTQKSTNPFYPDKEYSKEELKKMEEAGVKPRQNSYSGSGWEGVNINKNLSTKEQAKAVTDAMKKKYPDVKISRKSDVYSGGSSIDFNIMSSNKDLFVSDAEIDKMDDFGNLTANYEFERWAKENVKGFSDTHRTYTTDDQRRYAKEQLNNLKKHDVQNVRGDEWYLSDYGKKVVSDLNKEANSYTYDDSDAMTDYFNHGTYMWVSIGKWDKPYEVNKSSKTTSDVMNDVLREKGYKNYLKQHPGSKMTFEDFKKKK